MSFSNYLENKLLEHAFRVEPYTVPSALYLSLHTANPNEGNDGHEVSGGDYARQPISGLVSAGVFTASDMPIDFPAATASWGTITHIGVFDATSSGNLLVYGALAAPRAIGDGDIYRQTLLTISLD